MLLSPKVTRSIRLPPRTATVVAHTDVLIVGGGPAGLGAAIGAAKAGASVVLAERYGFLGGNATAALVMPLMSYHTQSEPSEPAPRRRLMPNDHGRGEPVIAGVLEHLVERMRLRGGVMGPSEETGYTVPFDPEVFKSAALGMVQEAGVRLLFHAFASGVVESLSALSVVPEERTVIRKAPGAGSRGAALEEVEGPSGCHRGAHRRVGGVVFETKSGPVVVEATVIVDCTGDGDIAALAGAPFELGREEDGLVQPMSLMFRVGGFEQQEFHDFVEQNEGEWHGVHGLSSLVREAVAAGELDVPREDILLFDGVTPGEVAVNATRVCKVSGVDVFDLTRAEIVARGQMEQLMAFFRRRVPGFAESYVIQAGGAVGVRETRRIVGEYMLDVDDVRSARKFDDVIARCSYPIDIHDPTCKGTWLERLPAGECYDIPLRCLLPQRVEGLIVAGRCMSGSHEAHSSYRVMPVSVATGQAAGVCAAAAVAGGKLPRDVFASCVQVELIRQGASLGDGRGVAFSCSCGGALCRVA